MKPYVVVLGDSLGGFVTTSGLCHVWLAGNWTDTGASTKVESAIASRDLCAQAVIKQSRGRI